MVDFDLINFRYRPDDFYGQQPFPKRFTGYENSVPSMVYGNASEFERVVDYMANYTLGPHNEFNGKPHVSDMHIIVDMRAKKLMDTADSPIFNRKMFHLSTQATLSSRKATGISDLSKIDLARLINHLKAA